MSSNDDVNTRDYGGDKVNYNPLFVTDQKFPSFDEAFVWANEIAKRKGFFLVKSSYKRNKNKYKPNLWRQYLHCENGPRKRSGEASVDNPRKTTTHKLGCSFALKVVETEDSTWQLCLMGDERGLHNHALEVYPEGHRQRVKFTDQDKATIRILDAANVRVMHMKQIINDSKESGCHNSKQFHNEKQKIRREAMGDMDVIQYLFHLAEKHKYITFSKSDVETGEMTHCFMAHPTHVLMLQVYYEVILIDATYNTNKYIFPLVEIVGLTPVNSNFTIAYCMMRDETSESYSWVLEHLKILLSESRVPTCICTDKEASLIKPIATIFRESRHLLCRWHVDNNVRAKAKLIFGTEALANAIVNGSWKKVVEAPTVARLELALQNLMSTWARGGPFRDYIIEEWIPHLEKFAFAHTNEVRHYGNSCTSRVESAHAALKIWLSTCTGSVDSVFRKIHSHHRAQIGQIKGLLEDSRNKVRSTGLGRPFRLLCCHISLYSISLLEEEKKRYESLGSTVVENCGCVLPRTHSLPCACMIHNAIQEGYEFYPYHVSQFWSRLVFEEGSINDHPRDARTAELDEFEMLVNQGRNAQPATVRALNIKINSLLHPEEEGMKEPQRKENPRGRPRKKSTRADPSWFEHVGRMPDRNSGSKGSKSRSSRRQSQPRTSNTVPVVPGAPLMRNYCIDVDVFPYKRQLPPEIFDYLIGWFNPTGDGHCGFRCISHAFRGEDDHFVQMRVSLIDEIGKPIYNEIYGGAESRGRATNRIRWENNGPCGRENWMSCPNDGYGFSSMHNWTVVVYYSRYQDDVLVEQSGYTILPMRTPIGTSEPAGILVLLNTGNHWVRLFPKETFPMPRVEPQWSYLCDRELISRWANLYGAHHALWESIISSS